MRRSYLERIKAKNLSANVNYEVYTIEEVIDTENLTNWLCDELNKLTDLDWYVEKDASFRDANSDGWKSPERIESKVVSVQKVNWIKLGFDVLCRDGLVIVKSSSISLNENSGYVTWIYEDLTKEDAKQIAQYIASKIKDETDNVLKNIKRSSTYESPKSDLQLRLLKKLKEIATQTSLVLPRGKQRSNIREVVYGNPRDISEVVIEYRDNASSPYKPICLFDIIDEGDDIVSLSCISSDNNEEIESISVVDEEQEEDEIRDFIKNSIIDQFDKYWKK